MSKQSWTFGYVAVCLNNVYFRVYYMYRGTYLKINHLDCIYESSTPEGITLLVNTVYNTDKNSFKDDILRLTRNKVFNHD